MTYTCGMRRKRKEVDRREDCGGCVEIKVNFSLKLNSNEGSLLTCEPKVIGL